MFQFIVLSIAVSLIPRVTHAADVIGRDESNGTRKYFYQPAAILNVITPGIPTNRFLHGSEVHTYAYDSGGDEWLVFSPPGIYAEGFPFNLQFELEELDGTILTPSGVTLQTYYLADAGLYRFTVRNIGDPSVPYRGSGYYGVCAVRYPGSNFVDAGEADVVVAGQTVEGATDYTDLDLYQYTAASNEVVTVVIAPHQSTSSYYQPAFDIVAPDGTVFATNQTYAQRLRFVGEGTYRFIIYDTDGYVGSLGPQPYQLTIIKHPGPNIGDAGETNFLYASQTVSGSLGFADLDSYEFDVAAGDTITLSVKRTDGNLYMNPRFDLYGPEATLLTAQLTNRLRLDCIQAPGRYQVVCRDDDFYERGAYVLRLAQSPDPPPAGAPPEHLSVLVCSDVVIVRWSTNAARFMLQRTDELRSPENLTTWADVSPPYPTYDGLHFVTNHSAHTTSFFRLQRLDP